MEFEQLSYVLVGAVSRSARECRGHVQVRQLSLSRIEPAAPPTTAVAASTEKTAANKPEPRETIVLSLRGVAASHRAVADFVVGLRESGLFQQVELKSSAQAESTAATGRAYFIECVL